MSGGGLALTLPPLVMFDLPSVTAWILGLLSLGFALHGLGVVRRHRTRVETDEEGLRFSPPRRRIAWDEITRFGLPFVLLLLHPAPTAPVDAAELVDRVPGHGFAARHVGGIQCRAGDAPVGGGDGSYRLGGVADVGGDHGSAFARQRLAIGAAQAPPAAGDDGDLPLKL